MARAIGARGVKMDRVRERNEERVDTEFHGMQDADLERFDDEWRQATDTRQFWTQHRATTRRLLGPHRDHGEGVGRLPPPPESAIRPAIAAPPDAAPHHHSRGSLPARRGYADADDAALSGLRSAHTPGMYIGAPAAPVYETPGVYQQRAAASSQAQGGNHTAGAAYPRPAAAYPSTGTAYPPPAAAYPAPGVQAAATQPRHSRRRV